MPLNKDWRDRPAVLAPAAGETPAEHEARIDAYAVANPGVLTPLNAVALEDLEARAQAELDAKPAAPGAYVSRARAFGTAYQPSTTRPVLVIATFSIYCINETGRIDVYVHPLSTGMLKVGQQRNANLNAGGISTEVPVTFLVPTGFHYYFGSVAETGAPAFSIRSVFEQTL